MARLDPELEGLYPFLLEKQKASLFKVSEFVFISI